MKKLICFLFHHKYRLHREITSTIREIKCKRCGKEFGMHDFLQIVVPLDEELKQFHERLLNEQKC